MKVHELIKELQKFPPDFAVHLDVMAPDDDEWEGDRVVRNLAGVRQQAGFNAVALDAYGYDEVEKTRMKRQEIKS